MHFSPSTGGSSPQIGGLRSSSASAEHEKYLSELLAERQKLGPFMQVLPNCSRLLNQEMVRVTALVGNSALLDQDGLEHGSPLSAGTFIHNGSSGDLNGWGDVCFFLSPSPSLHLMLFH
jgi:protein quaking